MHVENLTLECPLMILEQECYLAVWLKNCNTFLPSKQITKRQTL